jgi:hypothetical protein
LHFSERYGIIRTSNEGKKPEGGLATSDSKKEVVFMSLEMILFLNSLVEKGYIVSYRVTKDKVYVIIKK